MITFHKTMYEHHIVYLQSKCNNYEWNLRLLNGAAVFVLTLIRKIYNKKSLVLSDIVTDVSLENKYALRTAAMLFHFP